MYPVLPLGSILMQNSYSKNVVVKGFSIWMMILISMNNVEIKFLEN